MYTKVKQWGVPSALLWMAGGICHGDDAVETIQFGSGETVEIGEPPYDDMRDAAGRYEIPENRVNVYNGAKLFGPVDPLGITSSGKPIGDVGRNLRFDVLRQLNEAGDHVGWTSLSRELLIPRRSLISSDASFEHLVPLTRRSPELNYYHWMTEFLPRLRGVCAYNVRHGARPKILVERDPPSWVVESLTLAGVSPDECIEWEFEKIEVENLIVPRFNRKGFPTPFDPSPTDLAWIRNRLLSAVAAGPVETSSRIFVSREDADSRRLENREEIIDLVSEYGFDVVVPSERSVAEQVNLFRSADVIVGPHGAGLTNLLFAQDATLVELIPRDYTEIYYYMFAEFFDLEYEYLLGDAATPDFSVPVETLENTLSQIIG